MSAQREWFEKDYYKVLGVKKDASDKDITRAYRKLAKQFHPDANNGNDTRFKEVSEAYGVLGDDKQRKEYDDVRRMGPMAGGFGGDNRAGAGGSQFRMDDLGDLFDLFGGGGRRGRKPAGPARGDDLETDIRLSFDDAVKGITTAVNVTSDASCSVCSGTGAAPGTSPAICPTCHGQGTLAENQGMFSVSNVCRTCGGSGMRVEHPCKNCKGSGVERRPRQVKVRIPAGVTNGQRIRLKGRGAAGRSGGQAGDLFVRVHVGGHELFGVKGKDLTITVPVTFSEAALGAEVRVPTLQEPVTVKIPAGTKSGRTLRVRGRGIQSGTSSGDLLVTVEIDVPLKLSKKERELVEKLGSSLNGSVRKHLGV